MRALALPFLLVLGGCVTDASSEMVPAETETVRGSYNDIASCAYDRIARGVDPAVAKADLLGETRLSVTSGGVRLWELAFRPAGKGMTNIALTKAQTPVGAVKVDRVMPAVRECGR